MAGHIGDMVSQHWNTPQALVDKIADFYKACGYAGIDLDPCDNEHSFTKAKVSFKLPDRDGLDLPWKYADGQMIETVFCNPPYGRGIDKWVEKAWKTGINREVTLLIPASTETSFWFDYIWSSPCAICFLKGRIAFTLAGKKLASSTKGSALIYWGSEKHNFKEKFSDIGHVVLN